MTDSELVKKAKDGQKDAFGLLYQKYFQKIYRYCRINLKNDETAKDVCQESFVKAYKKIKDFNTDGTWSFQAFVFAIARNLIIDLSRKKKEANIDELDTLEDSFDLYDNFEKVETIKKVQSVLVKLEDIERQIVVLRYFEELPSLEVAKILKMNDGALRVRTHRIMDKLKVIFESMYGTRN